MKILKFTLLIFIIFMVPTFGLVAFGSTFGNLASLIFLALIMAYYSLNSKSSPIIALIILGILYFFISGLIFSGDTSEFIKDIFRYFLFVLGVQELSKHTTQKELCLLLLFGAFSILVNSLLFSNSYGRYSGFYFNPNKAGFVCIVGFALTYSIQNTKLRLTSQFLFTLCGILTLSRYFIMMLVLLNLVSIFQNKRNAIGLFAGGIAFILILSSSSFKLNTTRFSALQSVFSNEIDTKTITKESREETWALYTDQILGSPIFGSGYKALHGKNSVDLGVHNTYLMILGEAGILPFLLIIIFYLSLLIKSIKLFYEDAVYTYVSIVLVTALLVTHNYFNNYILLFVTIWLYNNIKNNSKVNQKIS